jgi:hypothetical protein
MNLFRRTPPPPEPPQRTPHPDSRVESELQRIIAMQRSAARCEARLKDLAVAQRNVDESRIEWAYDASHARALAEQSEDMRNERAELEDALAALHEAIVSRLAALGDDALMLYGQGS